MGLVVWEWVWWYGNGSGGMGLGLVVWEWVWWYGNETYILKYYFDLNTYSKFITTYMTVHVCIIRFYIK